MVRMVGSIATNVMQLYAVVCRICAVENKKGYKGETKVLMGMKSIFGNGQ